MDTHEGEADVGAAAVHVLPGSGLQLAASACCTLDTGAKPRYDCIVAPDPHIFDRRLLTARRDRAARTAAGHDFLLARVADEIAARLSAINRTFPVALDLGAHHGLLGRRLRRLPGTRLVIDMDAARRDKSGWLQTC